MVDLFPSGDRSGSPTLGGIGVDPHLQEGRLVCGPRAGAGMMTKGKHTQPTMCPKSSRVGKKDEQDPSPTTSLAVSCMRSFLSTCV